MYQKVSKGTKMYQKVPKRIKKTTKKDEQVLKKKVPASTSRVRLSLSRH